MILLDCRLPFSHQLICRAKHIVLAAAQTWSSSILPQLKPVETQLELAPQLMVLYSTRNPTPPYT